MILNGALLPNAASRLVVTAMLCLLFSIPLVHGSEWQPWEEAVFVEISKNYGSKAEQRMRRLHGIFQEYYSAPDMEKLKIVNDTMNQLPWIADRNKYNKNDYWATPFETITTFGGDCEDIAIAKLVALRAMGVPQQQLRLANVKIDRTGEQHMVLAYIEDPGLPAGTGNIYVLDNYVPDIREQQQRQDVTVLFTVDGTKNVRVIEEKDGKRFVVKEVDNARYGKIDTILEKIRETRAHYQQLNAGRPLF